MAILVASQPDGTFKVMDLADKEPISDEMVAVLKELSKDLKWEIISLEELIKEEAEIWTTEHGSYKYRGRWVWTVRTVKDEEE